MLIVSFEGGLGNQMFQYAFFTALKEKFSNIDVLADFSDINLRVHNGYELEKVFGIQMDACKLTDVAKYSEHCPKGIKGHRILNGLYSMRRCVCGVKHSFIRQENASVFYPEVFQVNPLYNYYYKGIWANEKYFANIKENLTNQFQFQGIVDEKNKKWVEMIKCSEAVSIHFRAGDYLQLHYDVCSQEYYREAIAYMEAKLTCPVFFVFSDDIQMARKIFGTCENLHYIDNNTGKESYRDMHLMSMCRHNIIANSTFSFWGAYLNRFNKKIVVAPQKPAGDCRYPYASKEWVLL